LEAFHKKNYNAAKKILINYNFSKRKKKKKKKAFQIEEMTYENGRKHD